MIAYYGVHGINLASSKKLIERVQNCIAINYVNNKFTLWKGGPYRNSNIKLDQFVDVIMHLIFLGITKSTRDLIQKWIGIALKPKQSNLSLKGILPPILEIY